MSEDEAFMRAIVDSPGDDTPRLVYADWLDDRDDPHGPYLRAEREWARTGKKQEVLRTLAAALDPVWAARVSRPPVGICADKIAMRTTHSPATATDLDAVEQQLRVTLPAEYRALLMNWNGAAPSINQPRHLHEIKSFTRIVDLVETVKMFHNYATRDHKPPRISRRTGRIERGPGLALDFIPIAYGDDLGIYLIGVRGKAVGKVAYLDQYGHEGREPDDLEVFFPSLSVLLAAIIEEVPEWYRLIKNGDTPKVLAWVDAGGDIDARYVNAHDDTECLLTLAIRENNPTLVRELRARGAKVTHAIRKEVDYLQGWDKRKMRAALTLKKVKKK